MFGCRVAFTTFTFEGAWQKQQANEWQTRQKRTRGFKGPAVRLQAAGTL